MGRGAGVQRVSRAPGPMGSPKLPLWGEQQPARGDEGEKDGLSNRGQPQQHPVPASLFGALHSLNKHPDSSSSICIPPSPCSLDEHLSNPDDFAVDLGDEPE